MISEEVPRVSQSAHRPPRDWRMIYASRLIVNDLVVVIIAVFGTQVLWFGANLVKPTVVGTASLVLSYTIVSLVLVVAWMVVLSIYGTREYRIVGTGSTEYKQIADATLRLFGLVAIAAFLTQVELARGYIILALPLGLFLLVLSRSIWRRWLSRQRKVGLFSSKVLLVGSSASALHIAKELARQPQAGYLVVGACVPSGLVADYLPGTDIPVFGNIDHLKAAMLTCGADTVVITSSDELAPERIRELSWSLEPGKQHLVVAPSLTDIGGPRIHTRPVAGLPLIHVETPRYQGGKRFTKRATDIVLSSLLILVLSPLLLAVAMGVRLSTPGDVFFRQERIGLNGAPFKMLKFRSMVVDAESRLAGLATETRSEGNSILFKMANDPRVTPIGRFLRRYSLDELPQLFNVFGGSMSVVGPRPPLQREVAQYESHVHRRFLVKPGITGLWQVSGRSDLSWEDSVRLDLYYVENWSMTGDLLILWKTARAVLASEGAY
ncbi:MAG: hypothetical protein JWR01_215 [Subtercola sp.]|nr:hypothetical protein [Subtercola sp.]